MNPKDPNGRVTAFGYRMWHVYCLLAPKFAGPDIRSKTMESAEQVEAMETDGTTAASDTVTGEEDYVDIDDLEEFDDEGPPPSDIDDDSGQRPKPLPSR